METFVNSLTVNKFELPLPYLSNLTDTNSEVSYNSRTANETQGTITPTRLSKNPTRYEIKLRELVIKLYSDKAVPEQDKNFSSEHMLQPIASSSIIRAITPDKVRDKKPTLQENDGTVKVGPKIMSIPQPLDMMRVKEPPLQSVVETRSEGYCSLDSSSLPPEEPRIASLSELQGYLMSFHDNSTDFEASRTLSVTDPALMTPVFNDSGIHLEFTRFDTDVSDAEAEEPGDKGEKKEREKLHVIMEDPGTSSVVEEEGVALGEDAAAPELQSFSTFQRFPLGGPITQICGQFSCGSEEPSHFDNSPEVYPAVRNSVVPATKDPLLEEVPADSGSCRELAIQRAGLEGKLELLQQEFSVVLEERKSLQIRLQAVETRLKEEIQRASVTKPSQIPLVDKLEQSKSDLESKLANLHSAYQEKRDSLAHAVEQLNASELTIQKLKEQLSMVEEEVVTREQTISSLQVEIESLQRSLEKAKEQNETFKKENQALNSDISSLIEAKDWLQKQLNTAQDARTKLQVRTSECESTLADKNNLIEQLRCENARTSQQLTELQRNSLAEKAEVLKHLEEVEEDIAHQNLAFKEAKIESQNMEETLNAKVVSLTNENKKLAQLISSNAEMREELEAAKEDVLLKAALLDTITKDKEDIKEQLQLARSSTLEYRKSLDELVLKLKKVKQELELAQENAEAKDNYIEHLQDEKRLLEGNLELANKERAACDGAVQSLRLDLDKVDRRFKLMKRELAAKTIQLEETKCQKDGFVTELRTLRDEFENQLVKSNGLREEFKQKEKLVENIQTAKEELETEVAVLTQHLNLTRDEVARIDEERSAIQEHLQFVLRENSQLEGKFHKSLLERARLEGELETTLKTDREEITTLQNENALLKEDKKAAQLHFERDLLKERDRAINLEQELKFVMDEIARKTTEYNKKLRSLTDALQEEKKNRETTEEEHRKTRKINEESLSELQKTFDSQLKQMQDEVSGLMKSKEQTEEKFAALQLSSESRLQAQSREMSRMEKQLSYLKNELERRKAEIEKLQICAIELEREKGRLAGVLASQKTLRKHAVEMEREVASREAVLIEKANEIKTLKEEVKLQQNTANETIKKLETEITDHSQQMQSLQDCLGKEKMENASLRYQQHNYKMEQEQSAKKINIAEKEIHRLQDKLNREISDGSVWRSQVESTKESLQEREILVSQLQRKSSLLEEQDKVKEDRIESLKWEAGQRSREVEFLKQQLRMVEERQHLDLENLKTALQASRSEVTSLRSDLSEARKAKCVYQNQTFELEDSVLSARQLTEKLKQDLFVKNQEITSLRNNILSARSLEILQEEVTKMANMDLNVDNPDGLEYHNRQSTISFKPVSSLQECMASLKSQISNLQKQINEHADSVQIATTSWRSFKENVHQLQASCGTQNYQQLRAERDHE